MHRSNELFNFLLERTKQLTEEWYESLDKSPSLEVPILEEKKLAQSLKKQNNDFHQHFCRLFILEESIFLKKLEQWILEISQTQEHSKIPLYSIVREFFKTRQQYLAFINEFGFLHKEKYSEETIELWNKKVIQAFDKVILWFVEEQYKTSAYKMKSQQETINELSSPVIIVNGNTALLPLVGAINATRAKLIVEKTLEQCSKGKVDNLLMDFSGVGMLDTIAVHSIHQLIDALTLMGVATTLSGIRPEIAQTAVQLGLRFDKVCTVSTLSKALPLKKIHI